VRQGRGGSGWCDPRCAPTAEWLGIVALPSQADHVASGAMSDDRRELATTWVTSPVPGPGRSRSPLCGHSANPTGPRLPTAPWCEVRACSARRPAGRRRSRAGSDGTPGTRTGSTTSRTRRTVGTTSGHPREEQRPVRAERPRAGSGGRGRRSVRGGSGCPSVGEPVCDLPGADAPEPSPVVARGGGSAVGGLRPPSPRGLGRRRSLPLRP
jgi:hypothetical protein